MKKTISLTLVLLTIVFAFAGCGSSKKITDEKIIGTWEFVQGDIYAVGNDDTVNLEIYKGGTAKENYGKGGWNDFTWEISNADDEVLNITTRGFAGFEGTTKGFTLVKNDGVLELHSVDGSIILEKVS